MTTFEIPTAPPETFSISLLGTQYKLKVVWSVQSNCWLLSVSDSDGNPLLSALPLITGADLLAQFEYLGIGGALTVATDNAPDAVPTHANMGKQGHLYFTPAGP